MKGIGLLLVGVIGVGLLMSVFRRPSYAATSPQGAYEAVVTVDAPPTLTAQIQHPPPSEWMVTGVYGGPGVWVDTFVSSTTGYGMVFKDGQLYRSFTSSVHIDGTGRFVVFSAPKGTGSPVPDYMVEAAFR